MTTSRCYLFCWPLWCVGLYLSNFAFLFLGWMRNSYIAHQCCHVNGELTTSDCYISHLITPYLQWILGCDRVSVSWFRSGNQCLITDGLAIRSFISDFSSIQRCLHSVLASRIYIHLRRSTYTTFVPSSMTPPHEMHSDQVELGTLSFAPYTACSGTVDTSMYTRCEGGVDGGKVV